MRSRSLSGSVGGSAMRARLVGLVLIPTLALTFFGGQGALQRRQLADRADHLARDVDLSVTALNTAILASNEQRLTAAATSGQAYGISIDQTSAILGFQVTESLLLAREEVDRDAGMQETLTGRGGPPELTRVRELVDKGGDRAQVERFYGALTDAAVQRWSAETEHLTTSSSETAQTPALSRSLRNLEGAAALYQVSTEQLGSSADIVIPGVTGSSGRERDVRLLTGLYKQLLLRLTAIQGDHRSASLDRLVAYDAYDVALDRMLAGQAAGGGLDIPGLGETFRAGLARDELLRTLLAATAQEAHDEAVEVGERARMQYQRFLFALTGLSLASIALALRVASSIVRPLARLERRAVDLSRGRLKADPLPLAGPREVAVVTRSINEAVATLGALEQKATALAVGDIDAALAARVPGELAELLDRSVHSLARSIQDRQRLQEQLLHDATHDSLTGLLNRRGAVAALDALLELSDGVIVVMFMDLDGFKQINDSLGHSFGEAVLMVTAERITDLAPAPAVLARLGGDEFVVAVSVAAPEDAEAFARSLIRGLSAPVALSGHNHRIGVSAGVSIARPGDGTPELLRWADVALYRAKQSGRDRFVVVDDGLRREVSARSRVEEALRAAIESDRLEVHYQQLTDARTGDLRGVEALVRWRQDDGSYLPPDEFIPVAEQSSLIVDLDRWVLASAARQVAEWRSNGRPDLHLSVNASARTVAASGFVAHVLTTLGRVGLASSGLAIEVTETVLINDLDGAATQLSALRAEGVSIAIDDFGTGYTSVAQLRSLPVDRLKIDRSFVARLDEHQEASLVHLVIQIGHVLGMEVVAEGVETEHQLEILRDLGCGVVQGYLYGRPLPASDFGTLHSCAAPGDLGMVAALA